MSTYKVTWNDIGVKYEFNKSEEGLSYEEAEALKRKLEDNIDVEYTSIKVRREKGYDNQ